MDLMELIARLRAHERGARQQCQCRSDWPNCMQCDCGLAADALEKLVRQCGNDLAEKPADRGVIGQRAGNQHGHDASGHDGGVEQ
jgi:hypothetical protein